jgi:CubicO group peptidase (beta-lactamase class C family)
MMRKYLFLSLLLFSFTSCHVARFVYYNNADIKDYKKFPQKIIHKPSDSFHFSESGKNLSMKVPAKFTNGNQEISFEKFLKDHKTVAFLIIRNDSILYESYFSDYSKESISPAFSAAKAFVSALTGIAISEGYIKSVHQPITDFLPELKDPGFKKITLEHLLNMRSGIKFDENYLNPFSQVPKFYYGLNLSKYIRKLKIKEEPDKNYEYISVNTLLLSMAIERATGKQLSQYLEEKIWQPCGMEYPASWNIDSRKDNTIKSFCCLNARARDFAKFGRLYLNSGNWNGKQIVPAEWVKRSETVMNDSRDGQNYHYTYQWRVTDYGAIFAKGLLGQYIWVNPAKKLIMVRLGKKYGDVDWAEFCNQLSKSITGN